MMALGGHRDGLSVGDARRTRLHLQPETLLEPFQVDAQVQVRQPADHRLVGLLLVLDLEAGVLLGQPVQGAGKLLLLPAAACAHRQAEHRPRIGHRRKVDVVLVVAVVQHRAQVQFLDLGDRGDVAGHGAFDLLVLASAQPEQVADLEWLAAVADEQLRFAPHGALVDPEHAQLADEGVVHDAEHRRQYMRLRVRGGGEWPGTGPFSLEERWSVALAGMREQARGHVEQRGDAGAGARGSEAHRHQVALAQALFERIVQFGPGQPAFATFQVVVHDRFVDLHHLVDDALVPVGHGAEVAVAPGLAEAVHHPAAAAGGKVEGQDLGTEHLAQPLQHARRIGALGIDAVDHDRPAQAALARPLHQAARAVLDAGGGIDHDQRGFHHGQRRQRGPAEVRIAGQVDQVEMQWLPVAGAVDAGDCRVDGMAAAFLDRVEVRGGAAAFDAAGGLDRAAGLQQGFEQRGLAGAGMAGERDVADVLCRVGHDGRSLPVWRAPGRRWARDGREPAGKARPCGRPHGADMAVRGRNTAFRAFARGAVMAGAHLSASPPHARVATQHGCTLRAGHVFRATLRPLTAKER